MFTYGQIIFRKQKYYCKSYLMGLITPSRVTQERDTMTKDKQGILEYQLYSISLPG